MKRFFTKAGRSIDKFFRDFTRYFHHFPDSLQYLWPTTPPSSILDINLDKDELFRHYLYLDRLEETKRSDSPSSEFWLHFHTLQLAELGLSAGTMPYSQAQQFLYEALASRKANQIIDIYFFWFTNLQRYEKDSLEIWNDRQILKRVILKKVKGIKPVGLRVYYLSWLLDIPEFVDHDTATTLVTAYTKDFLKILPAPVDFARVNHRPDKNYHFQDIKSYKFHGNETRWLNFFVSSAVRNSYQEYIQPLVSYFQELLWVYDPVLGDVYTTGYLLSFSRNKTIVSETLRQYFRSRVEDALPAFEPGFRGKDSLLGDLVRENVRNDQLDKAYDLLQQMTSQVDYGHAACNIMEVETDWIKIETKYLTQLLPIIAAEWQYQTSEEMFVKDYDRFMWMHFWIMAGLSAAEGGNYAILNRDDMLAYIQTGSPQMELDRLAKICAKAPLENQKLLAILLKRIDTIFNPPAVEFFDDEPDETDRDDIMYAIEALLTLKSHSLA